MSIRIKTEVSETQPQDYLVLPELDKKMQRQASFDPYAFRSSTLDAKSETEGEDSILSENREEIISHYSQILNFSRE